MPRWREEDDFAFQLALVLVEVGCGLHVEKNRLTADCAVRAGAPGLGISNERAEPRRKHVGSEAFHRPAAAKRSPSFQMCVGESPLAQFVPGIFFGPLEV